MVYIGKIHLAGGTGHEHIAEVEWINPADNKTKKCSTAQMVKWIRDEKGVAKVTDGAKEVQVGVVEANPPYLRTYADGNWTNNLLALPKY